MRLLALPLATCWLLVATSCTKPSTETALPALDEAQATPLVDAYLAAFNQHDAAQMAGLMHESIEVYYVGTDGKSQLGTSGKESMQAELVSYFAQFSDVESAVDGDVVINGRYRSYTERVNWTRDGEPQTQSSLAVLEFDGTLLLRVWYYPAQA